MVQEELNGKGNGRAGSMRKFWGTKNISKQSYGNLL